MVQPLLQVEQLTCERDDRELFRDLSFSLDAGAVMQVEGPNGSGKTTLLRTICGLSADYTGRIHWRGEPRRRALFNQDVLYLGHQPGIKHALTAQENLAWYASLDARIDAARIDEALAQVALTGFEDIPCAQLSAGQKRRVALARLHLSHAALWVLDEPFTALDRYGVRALETLLAAQAESGRSILLTSHHPLHLACPVTRLQLGEEAL